MCAVFFIDTQSKRIHLAVVCADRAERSDCSTLGLNAERGDCDHYSAILARISCTEKA